MATTDSTTRFSDRVADYVRYVPGYPDALVQTLVDEAGLASCSVVADIGSGTGISAELFLHQGCRVFGVEPNREMRAVAEDRYRSEPRFHSIDAKAEATSLGSGSINLIVAGQAFHWFDPMPTRIEWARILKPNGLIALFWNNRRTDTSPFTSDTSSCCGGSAPTTQKSITLASITPSYSDSLDLASSCLESFPSPRVLISPGYVGDCSLRLTLLRLVTRSMSRCWAS